MLVLSDRERMLCYSVKILLQLICLALALAAVTELEQIIFKRKSIKAEFGNTDLSIIAELTLVVFGNAH